MGDVEQMLTSHGIALDVGKPDPTPAVTAVAGADVAGSAKEA